MTTVTSRRRSPPVACPITMPASSQHTLEGACWFSAIVKLGRFCLLIRRTLAHPRHRRRHLLLRTRPIVPRNPARPDRLGNLRRNARFWRKMDRSTTDNPKEEAATILAGDDGPPTHSLERSAAITSNEPTTFYFRQAWLRESAYPVCLPADGYRCSVCSNN